jgi:general secretion pathway protein J
MRNKHQYGFTLLEILIALFIFTIVATITTEALHTTINNQRALSKRSRAFTELQMTLLLLSRDIEGAVLRPITNAKNSYESALTGSSSEFSLTRGGVQNPQSQLRTSQLQRVHYVEINDTLYRERWLALDSTPKTPHEKRALLHHVSKIRFEYLDDQRRFHDRFPPPESTKDELPRAIRVSLTLKKEGNITQLYLLPEQSISHANTS